MEQKWIPTSEQMPEDQEYVLVYQRDGGMEVAYYDARKDVWCRSCDDYWWVSNEYSNIIAWMPLPEDYKETNNG